MSMVQHYTGEANFASTLNSMSIILAGNAPPARSFAIIQSRNNGDSTYGGSAGNCFITAYISTDGTQLILDRVRNWDQAMRVDWDVYVMSADCVVSGEITLTRNTPDTWLGAGVWKDVVSTSILAGSQYYKFRILDIRGSGFGSNVSEYSIVSWDIVADGTCPIYHSCPAGTVLRYQFVKDALADDGGLSVAGSWGDLWKSDPRALMYSYGNNANKMSLFIGCSMAKNGNEPMHFPQYVFGATDLRFDQYIDAGSSLGQPTVGWTQGGQIDAAYHGYVDLLGSETSKDITLTAAVRIVGNFAVVNGPFFSFGSVNTYSEEFGDFAFTAQLVDRGDGYSNVVRLKRGTSGGNIPAKVSWSVVNLSGEGIVPVNYIDQRSMFRGIAIGIMKGIW